VDASSRDLEGLSDEQLFRVTYEDFVRAPEPNVAALADFLGISVDAQQAGVAGVSAASIGKGRSMLGEEAVARLEAVVAPTLQRLGYVH
jgi:hypothetical protein